MRAVVLVGGFGTRLRPLTFTTPKPMLPVGHRPIVENLVRMLAAAGIDEVVLGLGFKPEPFIEAFPDGTCAGVRLHYAVEPEPLDTAGAIRFAADHAGIDDTFVVVNGDVLEKANSHFPTNWSKGRLGERGRNQRTTVGSTKKEKRTHIYSKGFSSQTWCFYSFAGD